MNKSLISLLLFLVMACSKNGASTSSCDLSNIITVTTHNINTETFYFDFINGIGDSNNWHLALAAEGSYNMPSARLDSSLMIMIDNSSSFDCITSIDDTSLFSSEIDIISYKGDENVSICEDEAFCYDMNTHKVITSENNYILHLSPHQKLIKLHIELYSSGIIMFKYANLN